MTAILLPLSLSRASSAQTMPCWSSRPQVRNVFHKPRSVIFGLVAAGVMSRTPCSAKTLEAGIVTPELKLPTTNLTPSPMNLLETETPCFGSDASSPGSTSISWPRMPPALLMSSAACLTPWVSCAPKAALAPVIGAATPILMSACAVPANQSDKATQMDLRIAARTYPPNDFCDSLIAGRLTNSSACALSHKNAAALPFRSAAVSAHLLWAGDAEERAAGSALPSGVLTRRRSRTKIRGRATLGTREGGARASHRHICSNPILPSSPFFHTYQT